MGRRRQNTEINAGSMADIAFLLLVFFLVTTTMSSDFGQPGLLPPYEEEPDPNPPKVLERNVFVVLVNSNDQLLVEDEIMENVEELEQQAWEFIVNPNNDPNLPSRKALTKAGLQNELKTAKGAKEPKKAVIKTLETKLAAVELFGDLEISKGIISLQNDRGTSYNQYVQVRDQLNMAYARARNEFSKRQFNMPYDDLTDYQKKLIRVAIPSAISEAEPKEIGQ